ncbi:hypothetical protein HBA54_21615 [Pelagibius litoralis]|uniref:Alkylhydroperoxidase AhpD family core domain-containing protein n=1 Tax=Pelagibius litoralis TaxID=374515 RepID=A0A967KBN7_9PROT|nr:hypothetical protein [Pelagibius litoralis]NIA71202.1 hypothetical protein [Pelagibius litoralis]
MAWIERGLLNRLYRQNPEQFGWLRDAAAASPGVFWKLTLFAPLAGHRRAAPRALINMARIGALRAQDCGACLQIAVDYAVKEGTVRDHVRAALQAPDALPPQERMVLYYAQAVAGNRPEFVERVETVRRELGEAVLAELAFAVATTSLFPLAKRGLGVAAACDLERIAV